MPLHVGRIRRAPKLLAVRDNRSVVAQAVEAERDKWREACQQQQNIQAYESPGKQDSQVRKVSTHGILHVSTHLRAFY